MIVHSHKYPTPPPAATLFAGYELIESPLIDTAPVHQALVQKRLNELKERKEMLLDLNITTQATTTDYLTTITFNVCTHATEYPL